MGRSSVSSGVHSVAQFRCALVEEKLAAKKLIHLCFGQQVSVGVLTAGAEPPADPRPSGKVLRGQQIAQTKVENRRARRS